MYFAFTVSAPDHGSPLPVTQSVYYIILVPGGPVAALNFTWYRVALRIFPKEVVSWVATFRAYSETVGERIIHGCLV
ncbi:MAG: hypothetical protein NVS4B11_20630 [Ktedonobacteraceae bacterium]